MSRVLVVEDVEISRNIMGVMLKKFNCTVDMASNGLQALKLSFTNHYNLIFMDLGLPDISGITTTKLIRSFADPKFSGVPIVALTAHVDESYKAECLKAGMNGFLIKPVNGKDLRRYFDMYLSARVQSV